MTGVQTCALPICFPVTIPTELDGDSLLETAEFDGEELEELLAVEETELLLETPDEEGEADAGDDELDAGVLVKVCVTVGVGVDDFVGVFVNVGVVVAVRVGWLPQYSKINMDHYLE